MQSQDAPNDLSAIASLPVVSTITALVRSYRFLRPHRYELIRTGMHCIVGEKLAICLAAAMQCKERVSGMGHK